MRQIKKYKRVSINVLCFLSSVLIVLILGELILRTQGHQPWEIEKLNIRVEPGGKFAKKHSKLGYIHFPGHFKVILKDNYSFTVTHGADSLRLTEPFRTDIIEKERKEIWVFGCSYTHGWSLNDDETYPWLLQKEFPKYKIVNFGVGGYGTLQSLIQFREALKTRRKPAMVIVAYAAFHDIRNTFLRIRQQSIVPFNKLGPLIQPYGRFDRNGKLNYYMADVEYREFPLMRYSAFVHLLEKQFNKIEMHFSKSHKVSRAIMEDFYTLASKNNIQFVVAGIDLRSDKMLEHLDELGVSAVNISVDKKMKQYNNLPHDPHPSAEANRVYARKLSTYLKENFFTTPYKLSGISS